MKRLLFGLILLATLLLVPGMALAAGNHPPVTVPKGTQVGDVVVIGQNVVIAGTVNGDVTVLFGNLRLTATARVTQGVTAVGGTLTREAGAFVGGDVFTLQLGPDVLSGLGWGLTLYGVLSGLKLLWMTLTVGAALLWAVRAQRVPAAGHQPPYGRILAVGALWSLVLLLIMGALYSTLWGIPTALILLLVATVAGSLGLAMLAVRVGQGVEQVLGRTLHPWQTGALGVALLVLPTGIPLLGVVILAVALVAGLGQFVLGVRPKRPAVEPR